MARFHCPPSRLRDDAATLTLATDLPPSAGALQRAMRALRLELAAPAEAGEPPEPPQGPGWFDSSWDLGHGLEVREGRPGDAALHHEWLAAWSSSRAERFPARSAARVGRTVAAAAPDRFAGFDIAGLSLT